MITPKHARNQASGNAMWWIADAAKIWAISNKLLLSDKYIIESIGNYKTEKNNKHDIGYWEKEENEIYNKAMQ